MIFNPSAFDTVRPKQNMMTTHPEVTTTTTPANNVGVPPPRLSFRADPYVVVSPPRASHTFAQAFYNVETRTAPANEANMTTSMVSHVPKSAVPDAYVFPSQPNIVRHSIPVTPNPVSSQVPISVSYNSFVPLGLPKIREVVPEQQFPSSSVRAEVSVHQSQIGPLGNPSQGALMDDPGVRIARPNSVPNTTRPHVILGPPVTISQAPPTNRSVSPNSSPWYQVPSTSNVVLDPMGAQPQAPPMISSILPNPGPWYQATPYTNLRPHGAWGQTPLHSGINSGTHGPSFQGNFHLGVNTVPQNVSTQMPFNSNVNVGPQGASYQVPPFGGLSGSAMYHPASSSVTGPTNQGTLYQQPSPQVHVLTSPTRSSGLSQSERLAKSR
jgi:hypothetical protein